MSSKKSGSKRTPSSHEDKYAAKAALAAQNRAAEQRRWAAEAKRTADKAAAAEAIAALEARLQRIADGIPEWEREFLEAEPEQRDPSERPVVGLPADVEDDYFDLLISDEEWEEIGSYNRPEPLDEMDYQEEYHDLIDLGFTEQEARREVDWMRRMMNS